MLNTLFYGNTILQWGSALFGIAFAFVIGKAIYWVFNRWAKLLTSRTKTKLDDIIIDKVEEPIALAITLIGFRLSVNLLTLAEPVANGINGSIRFVVVLLVAWTITRLYDAFHTKYAMQLAAKTETDFDDQILPLLRTGVLFITWTLGIVIGLNNAGYDVGAILTGLGIGGLAIALAAQHVFGNLMGGLTIFFDRHFKVGDRIQLRGEAGKLIDGEVADIGLRTTKVKTRYEGRIVNIPNSIVSNQDVVNVGSEDSRQMFAVYKLSPTTSYQKVQLALALLKKIAEENENTTDMVITGFVQLTEVSRDIMLLYWIKPDASNLKTRTAINLEILRQFEENGIIFAENIHYEYQKEVVF